VAYCLYEIADRRLWADLRVLTALAAAGVATALATLPWLVPYLVLRASGFDARAFDEVRGYSADLLAWVTAAPANRVWGWLDTFVKAEGELFPGVVTVLLALLGVAGRTRTLWRATPPSTGRTWTKIAAPMILVAAIGATAFVLLVLATGDTYWRVLGLRVTMRHPWKGGVVAMVLGAALLAISPRARTLLRGIPGSAFGFFACSAALSALLTLGPVIDVGGIPTGLPTPYAALYAYVPGFDGLRVPARYAMLTACCLAVLGAYGARALMARGRVGMRAVGVMTLLFLMESTAAPISIDRRMSAKRLEDGPSRMFVGDETPDVYKFAATLPPSTVLLEFPFGSPAWDLQSVFYQPVHGHPIVNGYSGGFPRSFDDNKEAFTFLSDVPTVAWRRLLQSGATHVIVHRKAFRGGQADVIERWLVTQGATLRFVFGADRMFDVPR
jgi:hypothetical protein